MSEEMGRHGAIALVRGQDSASNGLCLTIRSFSFVELQNNGPFTSNHLIIVSLIQ